MVGGNDCLEPLVNSPGLVLEECNQEKATENDKDQGQDDVGPAELR